MKNQTRARQVYLQTAIAWSLVKHIHEVIAPPVNLLRFILTCFIKHPRLYTQEEQTKREIHFSRKW